MEDTNLAIQTGNVAADAQVKPVTFYDKNAGKNVTDYSANFKLCVNKTFTYNGKRHEKTMWSRVHNFLHTTNQYNFYKNNIKKGKRLAILGHIENNNYTGRNGKQYSYQLIPKQIKFISKKSDGTKVVKKQSMK